jgi:hypothetical protein
MCVPLAGWGLLRKFKRLLSHGGAVQQLNFDGRRLLRNDVRSHIVKKLNNSDITSVRCSLAHMLAPMLSFVEVVA